MSLGRRAFVTGLGCAAAAGTGRAAVVEAQPSAAGAVGMLYDATRCIGCRACTSACKAANGMPEERDPQALYEAPPDLSARTKTVIRLYRAGGEVSYVKAACMHCIDPACVSVCMFGALHRGRFGIVGYDKDRCIGCRYCQVACPFNVPKFEWDKAAPRIVKCELCRERVEQGKPPACVEACPREAIVFGGRADLLAEAHARLDRDPDRYQAKVYGEHDGGGTQVMMLSAVPFEKLGLPRLGDDPVPSLSETVQHSVYQGFVVPAGLYALLAGAIWRNRRASAAEAEGGGAPREEEPR